MMKPKIPVTLQAILAGYKWKDSTGGYSGDGVFHLTMPGQESLFLKMAPRQPGRGLTAEKLCLEWLVGQLSVPAMRYFGSDEEQDYLLMTAVPGVPSYEFTQTAEREQVIQLLAHGLRLIHAIPIANCPFDRRLVVKIEEAKWRTANGLVDEADFDKERQGKTAVALLDELLTAQPAGEDLVFTHGDYCMPNILIDGRQIGGFIDWGNGGIADRYQDLALAARSITYNWGVEWVRPFFTAYGIPEPNSMRVEFYKLLDEFF